MQPKIAARLFATGCLALLIAPQAVQASDALRKGEQVQAMTAYMEAERAYQAGDYAAAQEKAERAYILVPNDPEIRNLISKIQKARMAEQTDVLDAGAGSMQYRPSVARRDSRETVFSQGGREQEASPDFQARTPKNGGKIEEVVLDGEEAGAGRQKVARERFFPRLSWAAIERWFPTRPEDGRFEVLADTSTRAGFQRFYKEGIGAQPIVPGIGFSARTEIFEEAKAVDGYVTEAKQMGLREISQYKDAITPIFTRSWAFRAVADYDKWPRFTYEFDKRDIYHEFQNRFDFKNRNLETHFFSLLYSLPEMPLLGIVTLQPAYKRVYQESDDNPLTFADIDEFINAISVRPRENTELFFQWNWKEETGVHSEAHNITNVFTTQLRLAFPDWKLFVIPSFEYSDTDFSPGDDAYIRRTVFVDWGVDITERLRFSSKEQVIASGVSSPTSGNTNVRAQALSTFNKLSYEVVKDVDVSLLVDYSKARGLNAFDNYAIGAELQYFRPGILRASVGYKWTDYYIIDDSLNLFYFKLFLFQ